MDSIRQKQEKKKRGPTRGTCSVEGCGRVPSARGLCQTHLRHMALHGHPRPIRRYRVRAPDTVKFAGLRVTGECAEQIRRFAASRGISQGAAISFILEGWLAEARHPPGQRRKTQVRRAGPAASRSRPKGPPQ